ncbi:MAG: hypothetical protein AAGG44_21660 [Planctomycetota bacterium]
MRTRALSPTSLDKRLIVTLTVGLGLGLLAGGLAVWESSKHFHVLLAYCGLLLNLALLWDVRRNQKLRREAGSLLETPLILSQDKVLIERYKWLSESLLRIRWRQDPIYRSVAVEQLDDMVGRIREVSQGRVTYQGTETWRLVYDQLLRSPGLIHYRSVSWIRTTEYWQDEPGRQSLKANLELHESGQLNVERIAILADSLWPCDEQMPTERVRQWFHEQHTRGIWLKLVRESQLDSEPELLQDFGIYGSRAVGFQDLDDKARTLSFLLDFNLGTILEVEERWKRLQVYSTSYADLLDHFRFDE